MEAFVWHEACVLLQARVRWVVSGFDVVIGVPRALVCVLVCWDCLSWAGLVGLEAPGPLFVCALTYLPTCTSPYFGLEPVAFAAA